MAIKTTLAVALAAATVLGATTVASAQNPPIRSTRIAAGLNFPTGITHAPGDQTRLFVTQKTGAIRIIDLTTEPPTLLPTPFLNLSSLIGAVGSLNDERGLHGLAFHPNYPETPHFYVMYTTTAPSTVIRRYSVSVTNPNLATTVGNQIVMQYGQPFTNHNGGWIGFGPDGYLYISTGDGGSGNDPGNRAQQIVNQRHGKMLRIDIDGDDFPGDALANYAIPSTNPFVGAAGDDEIWAYGLRNPWRCSFDRLTGDLWIADVGQSAREEVNRQPATDANGANGGLNYGWRCMEGLNCTGLTGCICNSPALTLPVYQYTWGGTFGRSITGGYVYRGCLIPEMQGHYVFGDYVLQRVYGFNVDSIPGSNAAPNWTSLLSPSIEGFTFGNIAAFGEDALGELYIAQQTSSGGIFKIIRNPNAEPIEFKDCNENGWPDACEILGGIVTDKNGSGVPDECEVVECVGDFDGDGFVDGADLGFLLNLWGSNDPTADLNGDGIVDGADLGILLNAWGACK